MLRVEEGGRIGDVYVDPEEMRLGRVGMGSNGDTVVELGSGRVIDDVNGEGAKVVTDGGAQIGGVELVWAEVEGGCWTKSRTRRFRGFVRRS
jgi:hypothetical protein